MTVLVTGAAGFIGGHVVRRLGADGVRVVGLDRPGAPPLAEAAAWHAVDLEAPAGLEALLRAEAVTAVVHAGGVSGPMVMTDDPARLCAINVGGTVALLGGMRAAAVPRLVLCSSLDVYGPVAPDHPGEGQAPAPQTVYGASKAAAEALAQGWAREGGPQAVILRLGWAYGPGRTTRCTITDTLRGAVPPPIDPGAPTLYVHVDDVVDAIVAALRVPLRGQEPALIADVAGPDRATAGAARLIASGDQGASPDMAPLPLVPLRQCLGVVPRVTLAGGVARLRAVLTPSADPGSPAPPGQSPARR